jgi:hypothetical protein
MFAPYTKIFLAALPGRPARPENDLEGPAKVFAETLTRRCMVSRRHPIRVLQSC